MEDERVEYYFNLAFELAYCLHVNKEIAFFIAEDALDELPSLLGNQERNRRPVNGLKGFWKWGERARPLRKTITLTEPQLVQWLVYKQSEYWERQTESGEGFYLPTEEDMIVRYVEHLVFLTLRAGSFYVTLAVGPLLHQFDRRETRLFYDVLTQSDPARMKEMGYIGKQRLELLEKICRRFDEMVQTVKRPGDEKQFVARPMTPEVMQLVRQCLRQFTPWGTACVIEPGFDVTYIPELYFSGAPSSSEDLVEINRLHTLLDPECLSRFLEGLAIYIRMLPKSDQDKSCRYDTATGQLTIPQFSNVNLGVPRGDRFHSPDLTKEDYVRLRRTLNARAGRRKTFTPRQLCIYVDNTLYQKFDLELKSCIQFLIEPESGVVEMRGQDEAGELTLAILFVNFDLIPAGGVFRDWVVHEGGQKVGVELTPVHNTDGTLQGTSIEVRYAESNPIRKFSRLARQIRSRYAHLWRRPQQEAGSKPGRLVKAGVALSLLVIVLLLIWSQLLPPQPNVQTEEQAGPPIEENKPVAPLPPPLSPTTPTVPEKPVQLIARASWSNNPQSALGAILVEPTRGELKIVDLSQHRTDVLLNIPVYEDTGQAYSRYRLSLAAAEKRRWRQTLRAPKGSLTDSGHILNLTLSPQRLPRAGTIELRIEGWSSGQWQVIGSLTFKTQEH